MLGSRGRCVVHQKDAGALGVSADGCYWHRKTFDQKKQGLVGREVSLTLMSESQEAIR